jgi:hypothetical protein
LKIKEWVDEVLPAEHGNRQGLSYGQLTVLMLVLNRVYFGSSDAHIGPPVSGWKNKSTQPGSNSII